MSKAEQQADTDAASGADEIERERRKNPAMVTVADAVFGTRHNCRCEEACQAASYIARGETFRCRLTAK